MDSELLQQSLFWGSVQLKAGLNLIGYVGVLLLAAQKLLKFLFLQVKRL